MKHRQPIKWMVIMLIFFIYCTKPLKYGAFKVMKSWFSLHKIVCKYGLRLLSPYNQFKLSSHILPLTEFDPWNQNYETNGFL